MGVKSGVGAKGRRIESCVVPHHQENQVPGFPSARGARAAGQSPGRAPLPLPTSRVCAHSFWAPWLGARRAQSHRRCQAAQLGPTCPLLPSAHAQAEPGALPGETRWLGQLRGRDHATGQCPAPLGRVMGARGRGRRSAGIGTGSTGVVASAQFDVTFNSVMIRFA